MGCGVYLCLMVVNRLMTTIVLGFRYKYWCFLLVVEISGRLYIQRVISTDFYAKKKIVKLAYFDALIICEKNHY